MLENLPVEFAAMPFLALDIILWAVFTALRPLRSTIECED